MTTADAITARLAAGQNGVLSKQQALGLGVPLGQFKSQVGRDLLERVQMGVYRHAGAPSSWVGSLTAAALAGGPGAVVSHRTAGRLHGLDGVPGSRIEITVPDLDHPVRPGIVAHRTNRLDPADCCTVSGVPVTTIPRTLLDLGAVLSYEQVEHTVQDAIIRKVVTEGALAAVLERVGGRGRRGTAPLRAVLRHAVPDARLASMLEHKLHELVELAGLPAPELQYELRCTNGRRVFLDSAWPDRELAIEGDGDRWHGTATQRANDRARRRAIQATGWTIYSYGWSDVTESAAATLLELRRLGGH